MRQCVSNAWGVVGVDVVNPKGQPAEVLAACGLSRDPDLQFARQIWIPPRSIRRTWVPVKLPPISPVNEKVEIFSMLIDRSGGSEVVLRRAAERVQHSAFLRLNHDVPVTGVFLKEERLSEIDAQDAAYEAVIALRTARGHKRSLVLISDRDVPALPEAFDGLDQLVIFNDRFAEDVAVLQAIRCWLNDGGQVWIMLDRVEFANVERLLGDVFTCGFVDREELNEVHIQSLKPNSAVEYAPPETYEEPVDLVHVTVTDMEVTHTVDGWPAAFWRRVGRGKVAFTTLGAKAWIRRHRDLRPRWDPATMTDFEPLPQLDELPVLENRLARRVRPESLRPYLSAQIGYEIVSRRLIFSVLALFCGTLLVAGLWVVRRNRPEHMGWIAPVAAVTAVVPLTWLGMHSSQTVPATVGQAQILETGSLGSEITATGLLAFYNPSTADCPLGVCRGGVFEPEDAGLQGTTRRMVWTDLDQWHWENLRLPAGVRTATFCRSATLDNRLAVRGTFTSAGFQGRLSGPIDLLDDALIAVGGQPPLAVQVEGGRLLAGPEDLLADGQFVAHTLLSDEQRRRQLVYQEVLESRDGPYRSPGCPVLFGWTEPLDLGFQFPDGVRTVGSALWAIPVVIAPPQQAQLAVIPSPFVTFRAVKGPTGGGLSPLYNARTGQWVGSSKASRTWLRFQIPEAVLPLELQQARLTVEVTAPDRTVEIARWIEGRIESLSSRDNPIGQIRVTMEGSSLPEVDEHGGLLLGILTGQPTRRPPQGKEAMWKIDSVQLELAGRTSERRDRFAFP
jgi:hypothetical protein